MSVRWHSGARLAPRTRYRIGGPATFLGEVHDAAALRAAWAYLQSEPFFVLGAGANTLISDAGVDRRVIVLGREFKRVAIHETAIEAGAAAGIPGVTQAARRHGRKGWSFLEAVPGTIGGALAMNAGTRDTGIWDRVEWVDALVPGEPGPVRLRPADVCPGYRHIDVPEGIVFLSARLRAEPGEIAAIEDAHQSRRAEKLQAQPYDLPSCGSVWTNPPGYSAWKLVDGVGMRGEQRGGARVSEMHANFIVNEGGATAEDVIELMLETRRRVRDAYGVELVPEIRLWGFPADLLAELGAPALLAESGR